MISKFDTVIMLFILLGIASLADFYKVPLNQYVFGAILLALNANGKNGGSTNGGSGTSNAGVDASGAAKASPTA
jgi:hypothetical protein